MVAFDRGDIIEIVHHDAEGFPDAAGCGVAEPVDPLQPRAISASLLAEMTAHLAKDSVVVRDPAEALERAIAMASPEDAVFATGSLYLVGDLRGYWHSRTASRVLPQTARC